MRLIDGDLLMKTVFKDVVEVDEKIKCAELILAETVDKAPTIDAVPVVRCKDCARCVTHKGVPICNKWRTFPEVELDGFCSYGERRC